jgi:hypothetical protein
MDNGSVASRRDGIMDSSVHEARRLTFGVHWQNPCIQQPFGHDEEMAAHEIKHQVTDSAIAQVLSHYCIPLWFSYAIERLVTEMEEEKVQPSDLLCILTNDVSATAAAAIVAAIRRDNPHLFKSGRRTYYQCKLCDEKQ